jgi:hypothetical protein
MSLIIDQVAVSRKEEENGCIESNSLYCAENDS